jgi:hypothetical protein
MGDSATYFSDPGSAEQASNGVSSGFDLGSAIDSIDEMVRGWSENERLDALVLRAICRLSIDQQEQSTEGFTPWDIVEAVSAIRGRAWSSSDNKEQMADDVRRQWHKLQKLWASKSEGISQRFSDLGIGLAPSLAKFEGGGTGRPTKYRLEWIDQIKVVASATSTATNLPRDHVAVKYICEDIEDAGPIARLFTKGYELAGWRRGLFLVAVLVPVLLCWLLVVLLAASLSATAALGEKPLVTSVFSLAIVIWTTWVTVGPLLQLATLRIVLAPWWMQSVDDDRLLETRFPPRFQTKAIRAVRYTTSCPICGGKVIAKPGGREFRDRFVGRCEEAPIEHVFSFDHVTRDGRGLR